MKRFLSFLLAVALLISCVPVSPAFAEEIPEMIVDNKYVAPGGTVTVDIKLVNNPGIAGAKITVTFPEELTLVEAVKGETFAALDYTAPAALKSGCAFNWDSLDAEVAEDGTLLTLTFLASADAMSNQALRVEVSYNSGDIYNADLDNVDFNITDGIITDIW